MNAFSSTDNVLFDNIPNATIMRNDLLGGAKIPETLYKRTVPTRDKERFRGRVNIIGRFFMACRYLSAVVYETHVSVLTSLKTRVLFIVYCNACVRRNDFGEKTSGPNVANGISVLPLRVVCSCPANLFFFFLFVVVVLPVHLSSLCTVPYGVRTASHRRRSSRVHVSFVHRPLGVQRILVVSNARNPPPPSYCALTKDVLWSSWVSGSFTEKNSGIPMLLHLFCRF